MKHYVEINGKRHGPLTLDDLRAMWFQGTVSADTPYWAEGMPEWVPLADVKDIVEDSACSRTPPVLAPSPRFTIPQTRRWTLVEKGIAGGCLAMTVIFIGIGIIGVIKGVSTNSVRQNSWDGSVRQVEGYLRNNLKDPKSLEIIEWSRLESTGSGFVVRCKYRAKNSFGAFTVEDKVFRLDGSGTIVSVADYYP